MYGFLVRDFEPFHVGLFSGSTALLVLAVGLVGWGAPVGLCLLVATLAPAVIVVGYETIGHRHQAEITARVLSGSSSPDYATCRSSSCSAVPMLPVTGASSSRNRSRDATNRTRATSVMRPRRSGRNMRGA